MGSLLFQDVGVGFADAVVIQAAVVTTVATAAVVSFPPLKSSMVLLLPCSWLFRLSFRICIVSFHVTQCLSMSFHVHVFSPCFGLCRLRFELDYANQKTSTHRAQLIGTMTGEMSEASRSCMLRLMPAAYCWHLFAASLLR